MNRSSASSYEPYATQLAACSVRSRVAFALGVAELANATIDIPADVAERIRMTFGLAWQWEQSGDVSGDDISDALDNEKDGIGFDGHRVATSQKSAWVAVITALYYVCWHAYIVSGNERGMSEVVCEVGEETIDQVIDYARQVPGFNQAAVDRLAQYCIANHRAADDKDLGAPISRETMLEVAGWAS